MILEQKEIKKFEFDVGVAENIGHRHSMEDAHSYINNDGSFFAGVYDGHGGKDASIIAKDNLAKLFFEFLSKTSNIKKAFEQSYKQVSEIIKNKTDAGTTASNVYFDGATLHTAYVGDTKIIISINNKVLFFTKDHNPSDKKEKQRIEKEGGYVTYYDVPRLNGYLAVSRALGDKVVGKGLSSQPDISSHPLRKLSKQNRINITICCDGIFEPGISIEEVVSIVNKYKNPKESAKALVREAIERGTGDNVTAMVIRLILK